ncbi:MAG: DUF4238 domain-containing protein [Bacteroidota bacterium]
MAQNKKQHFVPQLLLRNFSVPGNKKQINLYDRKNDKFIPNIEIKNQAQEKYYYGKDLAFENFLSSIESLASNIFKNIVSTDKLPLRFSKDHEDLLKFISLLHKRTKASVKEHESQLNSIFQTMLKYDEKIKNKDFENLRIAHPEPAAFNLAITISSWPLYLDLDACILKNTTTKPFLISDNPVIILNPLLMKRKKYWLLRGPINKGLVILLPISPEYYLLLYDDWAYSLNSKEEMIELTKPSDIFNINILQSIACDNILYSSDINASKYLKSLAKEGMKFKKDVIIKEELQHIYDSSRIAVRSYYLEHKMNLNFSFLKEKEQTRNYDYEQEKVIPRSPELLEVAEKIIADEKEFMRKASQNSTQT